MNQNFNIFDFIQLGLIASGGDPNGQGQNKGDHPKDKSSNQKVILPMLHDPTKVQQEHLAFSPMMHSPSAFSHLSFQGALDPGALVYFLKMPGQSGGIILGQANDQVNYDQGAGGGGTNLLGGQYFQDLFNRETGILIAPNVKQTTQDGVVVKAIEEKGKKHKHALLKGLPSHNALQPSTGYKLEQVKEVPTARQHFDAIPNSDILSQLPGGLSSLGSMFSGLMGGMGGGGGGGSSSQQPQQPTNVNQGAGVGANTGQVTVGGETPMDRIKKVIAPQLFDAMISLATLTQGGDSDAPSFVTSNRVYVPTYLANAERLLSNVDSLEDLFVALHRLQYDESLFGLDELANTILTIETAWGNANVHIEITGEISLMYANSNTENAFVKSMTTSSSSPGMGSGGSGGGAGGSNMFGRSAALLQDMFKRLPQNNQKEAKRMHEKLNTESEAQRLWKFAQDTINGGNPLDPKNFIG